MMAPTRVKRTRRGDYQLRIPPGEREVLRGLPGQLREALQAPDDPALRRLRQVAHPDDPELQREYARMTGDDLTQQRLRAARTMEETIDAERLSEEQLQAWLGAVNDLRLILGTRLDVTEELEPAEVAPDDPRAPELALYGFLTWLEDDIVGALSQGLPG